MEEEIQEIAATSFFADLYHEVSRTDIVVNIIWQDENNSSAGLGANELDIGLTTEAARCLQFDEFYGFLEDES
jgi:hypothetical protein